MTRVLLSTFVCAAALAIGLATAWLQGENHARADRLDHAKRKDDLILAGNGTLEASILGRLYALERRWIDEPALVLEEVPER